MISLKKIKIDKYLIPVMLIELKDKFIINIPTQIGCPINCSFCISSKSSFIRNLTFIEIIQLIKSSYNTKKPILISFTGEGEALLNINNLNKVISFFDNDPSVIEFRVCISGFKSKRLNQLNKPSTNLNLQFSMHSPFSNKRKELIELSDEINVILDNIRLNSFKFHSIAVNYVLIDTFNDSDKDIYELVNIIDSEWILKLNPLLNNDNIITESLRLYEVSKILDIQHTNYKVFKKIGSTIKNNLFDNLSYKVI